MSQDILEKINQKKAEFELASGPEKYSTGLALADLMIASNENESAMEVLLEILPLCSASGQEGPVLRRMGEVSFRRSEFQAALDYLGRAEAALAESGDYRERFYIQRNYVWIYARQGHYHQAEECCRRAEEVMSHMTAGEKEAELIRADLLHLKALLAGAQGDRERAMTFYQQEIELLGRLQEHGNLAPAYINLGNIYYSQGRIVDCLDCQLRAKEILEYADNRFTLSVVYNNIAELYWYLGDYRRSQEYYEYHDDLTKLSNNLLDNIMSQAGLARVFRGLGNYPQAEQRFLGAIRMAEEIDSRAKKAILMSELADLYAEWGRERESEEYRRLSQEETMNTYGYRIPRLDLVEAKLLLLESRSGHPAKKSGLLERATKILQALLTGPMKIPSEEVVPGTEIVMEAQYLLAKAYKEMERRDDCRRHLRAALEMIEDFTGRLPSEFRSTYLERPEVKRVRELMADTEQWGP